MNVFTFITGFIFGLLLVEFFQKQNYKLKDIKALTAELENLIKKNEQLKTRIRVVEEDLVKLDDNIVFDERTGIFNLRKEVFLKDDYPVTLLDWLGSIISTNLIFHNDQKKTYQRVFKNPETIARERKRLQEEEYERIALRKKKSGSSSSSYSSSSSSDIGTIGACAATASFCC